MRRLTGADEDGPGVNRCGNRGSRDVRVVRKKKGRLGCGATHKKRERTRTRHAHAHPRRRTCARTRRHPGRRLGRGRVLEAGALRDGGSGRPGGRVAAIVHAVCPVGRVVGREKSVRTTWARFAAHRKNPSSPKSAHGAVVGWAHVRCRGGRARRTSARPTKRPGLDNAVRLFPLRTSGGVSPAPSSAPAFRAA